MRIRLDEIAATPWANGGGMTRELAVERIEGRDVWRMSVAEIDRDGPFSRFPGLARWHTIIDGAGLDLHGAGDVLRARPFEPLHFDGALALHARLLNGPCRAFNVIYDPRCTRVTVDVHEGLRSFDVAAGAFVFVASGTVAANGLGLVAGDAICPDVATAFSPAPGGKAMHVRFADATDQGSG